MTPEYRALLESFLQSAVKRNQWSVAKKQMVYIVDAVKKEQDLEKLRELGFIMLKIIALLADSSKRQHDEIAQWLKKKLEE